MVFGWDDRRRIFLGVLFYVHVNNLVKIIPVAVKPSIQQPHRRPKSKSGPLGPPGSAACYSMYSSVMPSSVTESPLPTRVLRRFNLPSHTGGGNGKSIGSSFLGFYKHKEEDAKSKKVIGRWWSDGCRLGKEMDSILVEETDDGGEKQRRCNWWWIVVASTEVAMEIMTGFLIEPSLCLHRRPPLS
ncbi:hypothetical protein L1887_30444 [Cichorium endivia]|nr:hypothetical protein L1887_30444 [Cichorium endivia]